MADDASVALSMDNMVREYVTPKNWKDACGGKALKEEKEWVGWKMKALAYARSRKLDGILLGREERPEESGIEQEVWDDKDIQLVAALLASVDDSLTYAFTHESMSLAQLWAGLARKFERVDMETQRRLEGELSRIEYSGSADELEAQVYSLRANLARFAPPDASAKRAYLEALDLRVKSEYLRAISGAFPSFYSYHKDANNPLN